MRRCDRFRFFICLVGMIVLVGSHVRSENEASESRMRRDIAILASGAFEGRGVTTQGINRAAEYVANAFKEAGLKPAGTDGTYFQPFTMAGATITGPNLIQVSGPQGQHMVLKYGEQFLPLGLSHSGKISASVVFAGYGLTVKTQELNYDDYANIDATDKVVIVLRDAPWADNKYLSFDGLRRRQHASFVQKMQNALKHKAAGILFVSDRDTARDGDELIEFGYTAVSASPAKIAAFHVRRTLVDQMLESSVGVRLRTLEEDIDRDLTPRSAPLPGWTVSLEANVTHGTIDVKNVVGVLEGGGPYANETVVVGAHYDHVGYGGFGSMAVGLKKPAIHHGADDNGSGTTTILELARRFGAIKERQGRRLVFMAFSGEESGLLGSAYYCKKPIFPLADTVAMVNLDMVGRLRKDARGGWARLLAMVHPTPTAGLPVLEVANAYERLPANFIEPKDKLIVYGTGSAKGFDALIERLNVKHDFRLQKVPSGMGPSDHASFYARKIPVFFFFTGDHEDYHRPTDTAEKINITGMCKIADLVTELVEHLCQVSERPQYVRVVEPRSERPEGRIPRIGIRPDYGFSGDGVMLSGVTEGGPAAKAGLKDGDCIVAINGKPVKNMEGYMTLIATHKMGHAMEITVERSGMKKIVKLVPE